MKFLYFTCMLFVATSALNLKALRQDNNCASSGPVNYPGPYTIEVNGAVSELMADEVLNLAADAAEGSFRDVTFFSGSSKREVEVRNVEVGADARVAATVSYLANTGNWKNRHHDTVNGEKAAEWLADQFNAIILATGRAMDAAVILRRHPTFLQSTVIVKKFGSDPQNYPGAIILSSHIDASVDLHPQQWAPGADDNAAGCAVLLELFYQMMYDLQYVNLYTVELHAYAASNQGFAGSIAIAQEYNSASVPVLSVVHFDQVGWVGSAPRPRVVAIQSNPAAVSAAMNAGLASSVGVTVNGQQPGWNVDQQCHGASPFCGDHSSWTAVGYPAVLVFGSPYDDTNPEAGSRWDLAADTNPDYIAYFVKFSKVFIAQF